MDRSQKGFEALFKAEFGSLTVYLNESDSHLMERLNVINKKLHELYPKHEFECDLKTIKWKTWPGQTSIMRKNLDIHAIFRCPNYNLITRLESSGGAIWTSDDLDKFELAFEYGGAKISKMPTELLTPSNAEIESLNLFPLDIYIIIMGYTYPYGFPSGMVAAFANTYFPHQMFNHCVESISSRIDDMKYTNRRDGISITIGTIRFSYENNSIYVIYEQEDSTFIMDYNNLTIQRIENGPFRRRFKKRPIAIDNIPKISTEVIKLFDPKDEFGLLKHYARNLA